MPFPQALEAIPSTRATIPGVMRRHVITAIVLTLIALNPAALAQRDETGDPAPRFRATTISGERFNHDSVKGKVVRFEFPWCKYCEEEAQLVDEIAKEFKSKDLIVLAVDVLEADETGKKYLVEHPRSVPIVLTKDTNLSAMYNAQVYPIYVVIDGDGRIAGEPSGAEENAAYEEGYFAPASIPTLK